MRNVKSTWLILDLTPTRVIALINRVGSYNPISERCFSRASSRGPRVSLRPASGPCGEARWRRGGRGKTGN